MKENKAYLNNKTTKRGLKNQLVKGLNDSLQAENKNFEGLCIETLGDNKFKMCIGPSYGYEKLTVIVLSDMNKYKELVENILLVADQYLATIDGIFQFQLKGPKNTSVSAYFGKYKIYSLKDCIIFIKI